eukprot:3430558-Pleurochrysis_carterae.AAC.1
MLLAAHVRTETHTAIRRICLGSVLSTLSLAGTFESAIVAQSVLALCSVSWLLAPSELASRAFPSELAWSHLSFGRVPLGEGQPGFEWSLLT